MAPITVRSLAVSHDSTRLAYPVYPATVAVRSLAGDAQERVLPGHALAVWSIAFHPDGRRLASAGGDQAIHVWDLLRGEEVRTLARTGSSDVTGLAVNRAGTRLAVAGARFGSQDGPPESVRLLDVATGHELHRLRAANGAVFDTDGRLLATGSVDGPVKLWDAQSGKELRTLRGHTRTCSVAGFSPDGTRLISGGDDRSIRIWDVIWGKELHRIETETDWVNCLALSSDGRFIAAFHQRERIGIWDAQTGAQLRVLDPPHPIRSLTFSPDGRLLASGGRDRVVHIWDAVTGQSLRTCHGHAGVIWSVAFSRDGKRLVTGSEDKTVRLWEVESGRELLVLPGVEGVPRRVIFTPDDNRIVAADPDIRLWDGAPAKE